MVYMLPFVTAHAQELVKVPADDLQVVLDEGAPRKIALGFAGTDPCSAEPGQQALSDTTDMLGWLSGFGFESTGNLWSNASGTSFDRTTFQAEVLAHAADLADDPAPADGHHELFIFYEGHGHAWFGLLPYPPAGDTNIDWTELYETLAQIPPGIVVTLFLNTCYGGYFTTYYADQLRALVDPASPTHLAGLTVVTTTDASSTTPVGLGMEDGGVEDFLEPYWDFRQGTMCERYEDMDEEACGAPTLLQFGVLPIDW